MNSFKYGCVVNGKWYCGRPFLERELSKFVASGQNVVLLGERRMGKTSLLHEPLRGMKGCRRFGTFTARRRFSRRRFAFCRSFVLSSITIRSVEVSAIRSM